MQSGLKGEASIERIITAFIFKRIGIPVVKAMAAQLVLANFVAQPPIRDIPGCWFGDFNFCYASHQALSTVKAMMVFTERPVFRIIKMDVHLLLCNKTGYGRSSDFKILSSFLLPDVDVCALEIRICGIGKISL